MPDWLLIGIAAGIAFGGMAIVGIEFSGRRPGPAPVPMSVTAMGAPRLALAAVAHRATDRQLAEIDALIASSAVDLAPAPAAELDEPTVDWVDTEALIRDLLLTPPTLPVLAGEVLHVRTHRDPLPLPAGGGPRHRRLPQIVDELADPSHDPATDTIWFDPSGDGLRGLPVRF